MGPPRPRESAFLSVYICFPSVRQPPVPLLFGQRILSKISIYITILCKPIATNFDGEFNLFEVYSFWYVSIGPAVSGRGRWGVNRYIFIRSFSQKGLSHRKVEEVRIRNVKLPIFNKRYFLLPVAVFDIVAM